ncbi:MAG: helix-turn-helix transcriptional regulator [Flavobacteriaceae bacterium]|nr:helix-turn-helix transcriptional regulator [Flavobacteriaceae bacterium]
MVINIHTIKEVKEQIAVLCKQNRKMMGLSRDELAELLDISSTTIQNIENGKNATIDNILKIANHFEFLSTIYDFLYDYVENVEAPSLY